MLPLAHHLILTASKQGIFVLRIEAVRLGFAKLELKENDLSVSHCIFFYLLCWGSNFFLSWGK